MRDLCIPIPEFLEKQLTEVEISVSGTKRKYNFRLESFDWDIDLSVPEDEKKTEIEKKVAHLKKQIESYDKKWKLIQIFNPDPGSKYINVLFREEVNQ
jgi:hypothetical protein